MLAAGPEQAHYSVRANLSWTANAKLWKRILKSIYIHGIAEEFKNELVLMMNFLAIVFRVVDICSNMLDIFAPNPLWSKTVSDTGRRTIF